ncbi:thioredoxin-disulfide reductase [Sphingobacterium tabacisoli]|uniref:Thioredoxin reductase n=1 Tax=Sphingobacterium tabacisoli TaxID=2044855 RepID=A0ABW5L2W9_9SPHI|nr:thioredoxin-disulfide reductase [Sphingobacterium tabacisoli]
MGNTTQCAIIGSGPAGYTAAIYASRAALSPVLFTGLQVGGQLMQTTEVDNFPGYPTGVFGPQLMEDLRQQALRFDTEIIQDDIVEIDFSDRPFRLIRHSGEITLADSIIIATGASAKWLGLENESRYFGIGVSGCATCDGFFYRDKSVVVVGGGDTALEEAFFLAKFAKEIHLLVRKDTFRASQILQNRLKQFPHITVHFNTELQDIIGDGKKIKSVIIKKSDNNATEQILNVEGVFVAIGHTPNAELFKGKLNLDERGYITTIKGSTKTGFPGVFACGDVQDSEYRQAITAAGSGCMAALDVERYLASRIEKNGIFCIEEESTISTIVSRNGINCLDNITL